MSTSAPIYQETAIAGISKYTDNCSASTKQPNSYLKASKQYILFTSHQFDMITDDIIFLIKK